MDSKQEAANLANIETMRLTRKLVFIGYATLTVCALGTVFAAWAVLRSPDTSQSPPLGGGFMLMKWLPVVTLGSCSLVLAIALFVISFRRWKYNKLASQIAEPSRESPTRESNILLESKETKRLTDEIATLKMQLSQVQDKAQTLDRGLAGKKQEMKEVQRARDRYQKELEQEKRLRESDAVSLEISRREVAEVRAEAAAQTRTYDETFKGMSEELAKAKEDAGEWQRSYHEVNNRVAPIKNLNENFKQQIEKLDADLKTAQSDAKEARREKLAADNNLRGVESDRNNYQTWYNELAWLKPAIEPQKEDISNYIKVIAARPSVLNLKERVAVVDLVIRNDSFFNIAIKPDAAGGRFATKKGLLHDPAKTLIDIDHLPVENLKPTKEATVAVIQPLLRSEAEDIEDAISEGSDGRFWLGNLNIPISVQNAEPLKVDPKPLRINSNVEHVYFSEFGGLTFEGEVITPQELVRDIDALPFPERLRIYQEMSKAYGESVWRLHEANQREDPEEIANEAIKPNTEQEANAES